MMKKLDIIAEISMIFWILEVAEITLATNYLFFLSPFLLFLGANNDEKIGYYCRNIDDILDIGGGRNDFGHQLSIEKNFGKIVEILAIYRFLDNKSTKNWSVE